MNDNEKLRVTFYMACAIEHSNPTSQDWKVKIKQELGKPDVGIYDPIEQEANKTGKSTQEVCEYISGLKRGGHWDRFHEEMECIWWGQIKIPLGCNKVSVMQIMRDRAIVDGNRRRDFGFWGDVEAVVRSTFIIAYMEKNVKTIGTIREITYAEMFNIPIYLIIPEQTKTDTNSTLIDMVKKSGGETFYSVNDCVKHIKEKYKV